ncbi:uncharacterized protein LY79DRAFT_535302 [Colletotrichum navitas]|uniref:Secreted protein n=1 Tax=Colletotrichum navitas TaxID=681940 RepID=A0AAD8VCG2_9PEZI|nr:uncharacterized protein LY79DRAFT_535302 [Colletotrichum navitas]KAK1599510.1 hypothetical protein LY79DRAFT_535302 [Colletotrichum navitas]
MGCGVRCWWRWLVACFRAGKKLRAGVLAPLFSSPSSVGYVQYGVVDAKYDACPSLYRYLSRLFYPSPPGRAGGGRTVRMLVFHSR